MGMPYRALPCSQSVQIMASVYVWIIDTVKGLLFWQLHVGLGVGLFDIDSSHLNGIHFKGAQMYREVGNMLFYTEISVCSDEVWVRFSASFCAMTETPEDWKARETTSRYHSLDMTLHVVMTYVMNMLATAKRDQRETG